MSIRKKTTCHYLAAEFYLFCGELAGLALPAVMQVVTEIVGIVAPICLNIVTQCNDPYITTLSFKGLQNKGEREISQGGVSEHLFNRPREMHTHTCIPAVKLGDHCCYGFFLIL